jgi:hypothetical protein
MGEMTVIRKVLLNERHLRPGRTHHTISDTKGRRDFPPFVSLFITDTQGHSEVVMWRHCENGQAAHTHHDTLDDAFNQAEFEFEIARCEWITTSEPFGSLIEYSG